MASDRIQRQIERFLDEAEDAVAHGDWGTAKDCAEKVFAFDPENSDGLAFSSPLATPLISRVAEAGRALTAAARDGGAEGLTGGRVIRTGPPGYIGGGGGHWQNPHRQLVDHLRRPELAWTAATTPTPCFSVLRQAQHERVSAAKRRRRPCWTRRWQSPATWTCDP